MEKVIAETVTCISGSLTERRKGLSRQWEEPLHTGDRLRARQMVLAEKWTTLKSREALWPFRQSWLGDRHSVDSLDRAASLFPTGYPGSFNDKFASGADLKAVLAYPDLPSPAWLYPKVPQYWEVVFYGSAGTLTPRSQKYGYPGPQTSARRRNLPPRDAPRNLPIRKFSGQLSKRGDFFPGDFNFFLKLFNFGVRERIFGKHPAWSKEETHYMLSAENMVKKFKKRVRELEGEDWEEEEEDEKNIGSLLVWLEGDYVKQSPFVDMLHRHLPSPLYVTPQTYRRLLNCRSAANFHAAHRTDPDFDEAAARARQHSEHAL